MEENQVLRRNRRLRLSMCAGEAELFQKTAVLSCQCDVLQPQPSCLDLAPNTRCGQHLGSSQSALGTCDTLLPAKTRTLCLNKQENGYTLAVLKAEADKIFLFLPLDGILDGSLIYDNSREYWHEVTIFKQNRPAQHLIFSLKASEESKRFNQRLCEVKKEILAQAEFDNQAALIERQEELLGSGRSPIKSISLESNAAAYDPTAASRHMLRPGVAAEAQESGIGPRGSVLMQQNKMNPEIMSQLSEELAAVIRVGNVRRAQEIAAHMALGQAHLRIMNSVSQQQYSLEQEISVTVHVEDRESALTLRDIKVKPSDTIADLKYMFLGKYGFPAEVQKWIIGKKIRTDTECLTKCDVNSSGHTLYLYLLNARAGNIIGSRDEYHPAQQASMTEGQGNSVRSTRDASGDYESMHFPGSSTPGSHQLGVTIPNLSQSLGQGHAQLPQAACHPPGHPTATSVDSLPSDFPTMSDITTPSDLTSGPFSGPGFGRVSGAAHTPAASDLPVTPAALRVQSHRARSAPEILQHSEDEEPTSLGQLGWQCDTCTLINTPTRPGCEACGSARPEDYRVPEGYVMMEEERQRHDREQREEELMRQSERLLREQNYQQLLQADSEDLVYNTNNFSCPICFEEVEVGQGIVLRECLHQFCRSCLVETVRLTEEAELACPYTDDNYTCYARLQDREIRALVSHEVYERHLQRSLSVAESNEMNSYHCVTTDCPGWCIYEDNVNFFHCPVCRRVNCLTCRAIHHGMDCKQYQEDLKIRAANDVAARQTQEVLKDMLRKGEAMECPQCHVILQKKDGCDWIRCSICKTEICWVTRGHRWGPSGKGDISGGCRCRVDEQKCHPQCNNCH